MNKILEIDYNYDQDVWNVVTPELKDLINHLLCSEEERYNAEEALEHEWIKKHEKNDETLSKDIPNCIKSIKKFSTFNKFKKILLTYFCTRIQNSKVIKEADIFEFLGKLSIIGEIYNPIQAFEEIKYPFIFDV